MRQPLKPTEGRIGRPRKHPPANAAKRIEDFAAEGRGREGIACGFGVSREIVLRWVRENPALAEAETRGRERERQWLHGRLRKIAETGEEKNALIAITFLLKTRHFYRGDEGAPESAPRVIINLPAALPLDQYRNAVTIHADVTRES